jgi:hypothetical protein
MIGGRPFIFPDTWEFYAWGHDVLAAIREPWSSGGLFPIGRELWAKHGPSGTSANINEAQFRLTLSMVGARSAFYAVPVYGLRWLWAVAGVQAVVTSWLLWIAVRAFDWQPQGPAFIGTASALTLSTTLPFYSAFIMPDVFTGLAVLATGLVLFFPYRLSGMERCGLLALIAYAVVAHTSNIPLLLVGLAVGALLIGSKNQLYITTLRVSPLAGALVVGLSVWAIGLWELKTVFGTPVQNPPFILARLIADGPGRDFLRERCDRVDYVICELRNVEVKNEGEILWHLLAGHFYPKAPFSARVDPERRQRLYAEERELVLSIIARDPLGQLVASSRNAAKQLISFKLEPTMDQLSSTLIWYERIAEGTASIAPNVQPCLGLRKLGGARAEDWAEVLADGHCYYSFRTWKLIDRWIKAVVAITALLIVVHLAAVLVKPESWRAVECEHLFALFALSMVVVNAVVCGTLSGPFDRFQARIVWLIPFAALVLEARTGILKRLLKGVFRRAILALTQF